MRRCVVAVGLLCGVVAMFFAACGAGAAPIFFGPTPYLQATDSPIFSATNEYFYREDFEDGSLSTTGVTATPSGVVTPKHDPDTDSVDADDGTIDGSGVDGRSLHTGDTTNSFSFDFDAVQLSEFPTRAGIVWTDVGTVDEGEFGVGTVIFEAFGPANESLGTIMADMLGDGAIDGQTAEDRFFGVINPPGISRITITMPHSMDWEVDHLQYLRVVPEPSVPEPAAVSLVTICLAGLALMRGRRN